MASPAGQRMGPPADQRDRTRLSTPVRTAIALCVALPMLIGVLITVGTFHPAPTPPPRLLGHWVYVPSDGTAVHVDGGTKKVDAHVQVGSASTGSQVVADRNTAYLADYDQVIMFRPGAGVVGSAPSAGVAERPVPIEAANTAYLVYQASGLVVRLGPHPMTVPAGGPLGAPVVTPAGALWVHRSDTGDICQVGTATLNCSARAPAGHAGALTLLDGNLVFVDLTAGAWQPVDQHGLGPATRLGVPLPPDAEVSATSVAGRLPIVDPNGRVLYLVSSHGGTISVPLGTGRFDRPVSTRDAVAVVDTDTGQVASYGSDGQRRGTMPMSGGAVSLTTGDDGRVYADSFDGLRSVVMDDDGTLTSVRTTGRDAPSYQPQAPVAAVSLPPATVVPTTPESIPPAPDVFTVDAPPSTPGSGTGAGTPGAGGSTGAGTGSTRPRPPNSPVPGPPAGSPVVDVLGATATGPGQATVRIHVTGDGPVFCHVFFNSVERDGTDCAGTMQVVVTGLPEHTLFDVYVIGTNAKGTGDPGRRAVVRT